MGRTKRRRIKKALSETKNLDHESSSINLQKWLDRNKWENDKNLRLCNFQETSRGVCSSKNIQKNEVFIRIPYELVITYKTLELNGFLQYILHKDRKFKLIDLLALFLVVENQKGGNSKYRNYVDSLPYPEPVLPWFCTSDELNLYPPDLQIPCKKDLAEYQESFLRASRSISSSVCVTSDLYKWAYVLVNTRAVYVDPQVCCRTSSSDVLLDEPSMALCPFLDMFNHHYLAKTDAEIVMTAGRLFYQLRTQAKIKRFEQIFICYGPHDNSKLLREYGFFVPGNVYDCVRFDFNEVQAVLRFSLDARRYKFVKDHGFDTPEKLYINSSGMSFSLKALLFVAYDDNAKEYAATIFGDTYSEEFCERFKVMTRSLLSYKCEVFGRDYKRLRDCGFELSEYAKLMLTYLEYRVNFVQNLIN